jgi:quinol monooxygenase YgiN
MTKPSIGTLQGRITLVPTTPEESDDRRALVMTCHPDKTEKAIGVLREVIAASRELEGVVTFDIGRDVADPDSLIATEVFRDREALDRQESLPQVAKAIDLFKEVLAAPPEAMIFHVSSSEPYE